MISKVWNKKNYKLPKDTSKYYTFLFMSDNPLVKHNILYKNELILFIANRDSTSYTIMLHTETDKLNWEVLPYYPEIKTIEDVQQKISHYLPVSTSFKGLLVIENKKKFIKFIAPNYESLSQILKEEDTIIRLKAFVLLILALNINDNYIDEFIEAFPAYKDSTIKLKFNYDQFAAEVDELASEIMDIDDDKQFAIKIYEQKLSKSVQSLLFSLRKARIFSCKYFLGRYEEATNERFRENIYKWLKIAESELDIPGPIIIRP